MKRHNWKNNDNVKSHDVDTAFYHVTPKNYLLRRKQVTTINHEPEYFLLSLLTFL